MVHELKIYPRFFNDIRERRKNFELRRNDRDFKVGDTLHLKEWSDINHSYTGETFACVISYILQDWIGLTPGYCILGLS